MLILNTFPSSFSSVSPIYPASVVVLSLLSSITFIVFRLYTSPLSLYTFAVKVLTPSLYSKLASYIDNPSTV